MIVTNHLTKNAIYLLQELSTLLSLDIDASKGAIQLTQRDGHPWMIEITRDSQYMVIHSALVEQISFATMEKLEWWLSLNTHIELLKGAWIGIEPSTQTLRLCFMAAIDTLDIRILEERLRHVLDLRSHILSLQAA